MRYIVHIEMEIEAESERHAIGMAVESVEPGTPSRFQRVCFTTPRPGSIPQVDVPTRLRDSFDEALRSRSGRLDVVDVDRVLRGVFDDE